MEDIKKNNPLWQEGEATAVAFLSEKAYEIMFRNWRYTPYEIDIIAKHNNQIVIIEVKARQSFFCADPHTTVTKRKQKFLIKAAEAFLNLNKIENETRFDIVTVIFADGKKEIQHIEDAFYPTL